MFCCAFFLCVWISFFCSVSPSCVARASGRGHEGDAQHSTPTPRDTAAFSARGRPCGRGPNRQELGSDFPSLERYYFAVYTTEYRGSTEARRLSCDPFLFFRTLSKRVGQRTLQTRARNFCPERMCSAFVYMHKTLQNSGAQAPHYCCFLFGLAIQRRVGPPKLLTSGSSIFRDLPQHSRNKCVAHSPTDARACTTFARSPKIKRTMAEGWGSMYAHTSAYFVRCEKTVKQQPRYAESSHHLG